MIITIMPLFFLGNQSAAKGLAIINRSRGG